MDRLVGLADVERVPVGVGEDRDRAHPEPPGGADDPAGDLAPVGDEEGFDHSSSPIALPKLWSSTGSIRLPVR